MYPTIDSVETGRLIQKYMEKNYLSAKDVQKTLGLTCVQSVYHWINGRCLPSLDNLYALSDVFNVSMDSLIVGSKSNKENKCEKNKYGVVYAYYLKLYRLAS